MKAIVQLADKQKALEERNAALEAKITALTAPAAAPAAAPAPAKENPQDAAYRRVLAELGIKEDLQ